MKYTKCHGFFICFILFYFFIYFGGGGHFNDYLLIQIILSRIEAPLEVC